MNTAQQTTSPALHERSTFRMKYSVAIDIAADPERIWSLLTDGPGMARWNSTIESIEGTIAEGNTITLKAKIAPGREFKLKIGTMVPGRTMVWSDGFAPVFRGVRTFTLTQQPDGSTRFAMEEVLSGMMLPMIAGSLPDFGPAFEAYARDLKRASEAN